MTMKLTFHDGRFIFESTFTEKDIPKAAGCRWSPVEKKWWTDRADVAQKLAQHADDNARVELRRVLEIPPVFFQTDSVPPSTHVSGTPYILRDYQKQAVDAAVGYLRGQSKKNAIEILPTGSGKSLILANIAKALGEPTLIFQPSKEILEQNLEKLRSYGYDAEIYSASMGQKNIGNITFATIGSTFRKVDLFKNFRYVLIDEAHGVNSKQGMYKSFLSQMDGTKLCGFTATPYRLTTDGFGGSILKFLTRTRPRVFHEVIYYVQNRTLFDAGYLSKLQYACPGKFDRSHLRLNSTGADFTDESVRNYYKDIDFRDLVVSVVTEEMKTRKNTLVFTRFVEEAEYLTDRITGAAIVTAETPKRERERVVHGFRTGKTKVVCNVGIFTLGFDYPELETVIIARPTMSLALFYQMVGRSVRPHPGKKYSEIVDLCGNLRFFGKVEDLQIVDGGNGKWFIENNGKQLTNIYYGER